MFQDGFTGPGKWLRSVSIDPAAPRSVLACEDLEAVLTRTMNAISRPEKFSQPEKRLVESTSPSTRPTATANAVGMTNSTAISFRVIAEARFDLPLAPEHHLRMSRANLESLIRTRSIPHHRDRLFLQVEIRPHVGAALATCWHLQGEALRRAAT